MVEQVIVIVIVGLVSAFLGAMLALRFQRSYWKNVHAGQDGWENAQQSHHRNWQEKQEKLIAEAESKFTAQVHQLHREWQQWETRDAERIAEHTRQQERSDEQARIERELARLPRIEETSMSLASKQTTGSLSSPHWRPATLQGADLSGLDLSHRYLGRADLRNAQLSRTNFFMADLSGVCLADANLTEADLSGANLSNADLRGAILSGTNLLVADLNNAILTGANLLNARNLTSQQIYTTFYDSTTRLDADIDITLPRTSSKHLTFEGVLSCPSHNETINSVEFELAENNELPSDNIFEVTMPALPIIKPELEQVIAQESLLPISTPQNEGDESTQPETLLPITNTMNDLSDIDEFAQPVSELIDDMNFLEAPAQPETPLPLTDTSEIINEIPQEDGDLRQANLEESENSLLPTHTATSDELATSDQEIHLLAENQESKQPEKIVTPLRKTKRHGRKRAKVG